MSRAHAQDNFDFAQDGRPQDPNDLLGSLDLVPVSQNYEYLNKEIILQELADKQFPIEDSELIFKGFERITDNLYFQASYHNATQLRDVVPGALSPTVSMVFLGGADMMSVNQDEQRGMTSAEPNQKSPRWRVLTAGGLLRNIEIDDKLTLRHIDCTPDVVKRIKGRRPPDTSDTALSRALSLRSREDSVLTIDSDNVTIVNKLLPGSTDLEATFIEVDKSSLFGLVIDFHQVIRNGSVDMNTSTESRVRLLETMVENARRLAIRSPILFRMSTRRQIARSKNTRYGIDHGTMFETITTSVGIKNIISKSAACYNSLAVPGQRNNKEQALVKPKFLQMLTLLLSLLNDDDLGDIASFLEKTYRIKADRSSIEILVLKVLPLQSINKSIFAREMFLAVNTQQTQHLSDDEEDTWNSFLTRLISQKYVLPGYTEQMGQCDQSWVIKYPEGDGIKDSYVFNHLQYGEEAATINEIPFMDLGTSKRTGQVTSLLTNKRQYSIDVSDHQKITNMLFGSYPLTEITGQRRTYNLAINEVIVNDYLNQAIQKTNQILSIVNRYFAAPRGKLNPFKKDRPIMYPDINSCGRLTFHEAMLGDQRLAVAYKIEGKKISRTDLIRDLAADTRKVRTTLHRITLELHRYDGKRIAEETRETIVGIKQRMPEIEQCLARAERIKGQLDNAYIDTSNEPIEQTIFPSSVSGSGVVHWSPYHLILIDGQLHVKAHRQQVRNVRWINEELVEVHFRDDNRKFSLSPLRPVTREEQGWEIRPDDKVLMVGQYIVIVTLEESEDIELDARETNMPIHHHNHTPPQHHPRTPSGGTAHGHHPGYPPSPHPPPPHQRVPSGGHNNYPLGHPANPVPYPTPEPTPVRQHSGGGEHYIAYNDRYATARDVRPEIFANWIKVVGVEQGMTDPRKINRKRLSNWSESVFH